MSDPDVDLLARTFGIARAFRRPLHFPRRLFWITLLLLGFVGFTLLARYGVPWARMTAGLGLGLTLVLTLVLARRARKTWEDPLRSLFLSLRRWDEERAKKAVRALVTYRRLEALRATDESRESPDLARLHFNRVLDAVPMAEIETLGQSLRRRRLLFIVPLLCAGIAFVWSRPLLLFEGVDVLFAQKGVGPYSIAYVSDFRVTAELPAYLEGAGKKHALGSEIVAVPQGSQVEVKVVPRVVGRKFILTDGMKEVPLVSDGQGGLVARWSATDAAMLRVATRLGEVLLYDGNGVLLAPLEDQAPKVRLAGAPARKQLEEVDELLLEYLAMDDHGITQIDLVIQSGQRVVREELARLDGQKALYQGVHRLPPDHEILLRAFLPVRVTIEARDGNTATGPNWGKSEAIVLLPRPLGQDVADRHRSLRTFRRALTKYLAEDLRAAHLTRASADEARKAAQTELQTALETLKKELEKSAQVPVNTLVFLEAQVEALTRKGAERSSSEAVVLAADTLIEDIGNREAKELAEDLGGAVEEIAVQAREIRHNPDGIKETGLQDLALGAELGAAELRDVGILGLDLGAVAAGDLARIKRNLKDKEYGRAEAAALHLAERLKRGTPSFGSKGGAVESGMPSSGSSGAGESDAPPSSAPSEFQELSKEVDQLAQESAEELSELERMLRDARRAAEADFQTSDELEGATEELRRALRSLPNNATSPGSARSEAASARAHGEAMVEALEAQDLAEAMERGMDAKEAIERARKLMEQQSWLDPTSVEEARAALDRALKEAERAREELGKRQAGQIKESLAERAARQREMSRRAEELAARGRKPDAPLPGESIEALKRAARLMEEAAAEMDAGRGEQGAERASEAQSELERALPQPEAGEARASGGPEGEGEMSREGSVPDEERDRAREFRERVEKGLGRGAGRLSPAVRRYAEELK
jgi:hypothetical protein